LKGLKDKIPEMVIFIVFELPADVVFEISIIDLDGDEVTKFKDRVEHSIAIFG
jgi:hypothetical protein